MSLSRKIILELSVSAGIILGLTFAIIYYLTSQSFLVVEKQSLLDNLNRAEQTLASIVDNIHVKSSDWANWDDSYEFVTTRYPDYISSNLEPISLSHLNLNTILIFDSQNELVAGQYIDAPAEILLAYFQKLHPDLIKFSSQTESRSGMIFIDSRPMIVSIRPISNSAATAPPRGTIIFGQFITENTLSDINRISKNQVSLTPSSSKISPTITYPTSNLQQAQTTLPDIFNNPSFTLSITRARPIYETSQRTTLYFLVTIVIAFITIVTLLARVITTTVLGRIQTLAHGVTNIYTSQSFEQRLPESGSDEISILIASFNKMLATLESRVNSSKNAASAMTNVLEDERELENKLKAERDQASAIINSMGEGLLTVDRNARIVIINPTAEQLLEVTAANVIGKPWSEIVSTIKTNDSVPTLERSFSQTLTQNKIIVTTMDQNHYYKTHTGKVFPIASITAPITNSSGVAIGAVKVFRDVTHDKEEKTLIEKTVEERTRELREKNQALEQAKREVSAGWFQLQQEKARLTASIQNLPLGFVLTDMYEKVLIANPQASTILDFKQTPTNLSELATLLNLPLHDYHQRSCAEKHPLEIKDVPYKTKILHLFISPILVPTGNQECIGSALLIEDITEAKILERSRDEFFSIASHELRTPLTAIRGNTSMILQYFGDKLTDPTFKEMVDDVHESSIRLIGIVNDFLDVSRLEQGRIEFKKEAVDIVALAAKVIEEFQVTSSQLKIALELKHPTDSIPESTSDPDKTKQVLINLVGNALKFTKEGIITLSFVKQGTMVEVQVTDTGRGIPINNQKLLFHKFQQAGSSLYTRDTTKGTGLGLYISKLIVEGQGGKIYLSRSEPNVGSTFAFTIPASSSS